jgi:uncharacterized alkaline shock family protein YloU
MPENPISDVEEGLQLYPGEGGIGSILINPDVIARIAGIAASEIDGVSLGSKFTLADFLPTKEPVRGIQVVRSETSGNYSIICEVKMAYGQQMRELAAKLQRHVKETVERMTSLSLENVDIRIIDIYVDRKDRDRDRDKDDEE